ncbi:MULTISPECIES: NAD(P)H-hydrate epimerase [unclassified Cellulophaga]|uniref:NAD(P)H-hydrate epimerase n=1 Tax=unclassified Cellulophaga TaxID=2634405 RepID=UPI0026E1EAA2|nr:MULTISPECIES: NAD(P)H-hydrate epimerase [unclassified Cellulophaga]MDO6490853.1 NAD(P)H-hydrate epimerase [Cellulophaga sp. 2_MG-2023]MDO6493953.1 NAD(P)H-hydrate epimerase [Cellulophaga sp. 3_MG-2023]
MQVTSLSLDAFKEMDYWAVEKYNLSIALMMENAGLQLARLVAKKATKGSVITIGVGNGNNGGGGLVAARRLAAWGFNINLDLAVSITKELPKAQLERALLFGAKEGITKKTDIWVDAYLGFSQRLPLSAVFTNKIKVANASSAFKISLDIPVGISKDGELFGFKANQIMTLAAPKTILEKLPSGVEVFVADIGIPKSVYEHFNIKMPNFSENQLISL